jgi:hypothetical protein
MTKAEFQQKLQPIPNTGQGNCLFLALSEGLYENAKYWRRLKARLADFLRGTVLKADSHLLRGPGNFLDGELLRVGDILDRVGAWGNTTCIELFEFTFGVPVYVWTAPEGKNSLYTVSKVPYPSDIFGTRWQKVIHVLHTNGNHFELLRPNMYYSATVTEIPSSTTRIPSTESFHTPLQRVRTLSTCSDDSTTARKTFMSQDSSESVSVAGTRSHSIGSGSRSSTTSSESSGRAPRPTHREFCEKLGSGNIAVDVAMRLKTRDRCCVRGCVLVQRSLEDATAVIGILSTVLRCPVDNIFACRQEMARRGAHERGEFVFNEYKTAHTRRAENGGEVLHTVIVPYDPVPKMVCRRAFNVIYGVTSSMAAGKVRQFWRGDYSRGQRRRLVRRFALSRTSPLTRRSSRKNNMSAYNSSPISARRWENTCPQTATRSE